MAQDLQILIIMGSVRKNRLCPDIAKWVALIGAEIIPEAAIEIVDLRDWPLPMDAEPGVPAHSDYVSDSTKAWSAKVAAANGFVFVTPQYNWGYPAALKNAIDHLYREWRDKPAVIVSYGGHGGGKCASQLREVLSGLKMRVVPEMPGLTLAKSVIEANPGRLDAGIAFADQRPVIAQAFQALAALA
ncbi:NADPH-dependent FMN reductase [Brucella sp. IR073]|uniref:NADPH-dependent FMN reductase n=1 Tax=unclassified Brucella TaxID=2632610 RepID=UPI003B98811E